MLENALPKTPDNVPDNVPDDYGYSTRPKGMTATCVRVKTCKVHFNSRQVLSTVQNNVSQQSSNAFVIKGAKAVTDI